MLGAATSLFVPFIVGRETGYLRNIFLLFLWGLFIDFAVGFNLGQTSSFFLAETGLVFVYSRKFELGTAAKLLIAIPSAIVYFYVSRRFFWRAYPL